MRLSYYIILLTAFVACSAGSSVSAGDHSMVNVSKLRRSISFRVDGPYVFRKKDKLIAKSIKLEGTNFQVIEKTFSFNDGTQPVIVCESESMKGLSFEVPIRKPQSSPPSTYDEPEKIFAISDIEGNFKALVLSLQGNNVIDKDLKWSYGKGHLVLVGDFFDRGDDVTAVLWLLYKLEAEAQAQGGMVHFIIGNHEEMNIRGDLRYVRDKYKIVARKLNMPYKSLYGKNTVLGNWLRSKNMIEKVGQNLFVHGGLSPRVANYNIRLKNMNELGRTYYGTEKWRMKEKGGMAELMFANQGPMWYRGYFSNTLQQKDVDQICQKYSVQRIIVGHTIVNEISTLYKGRIVAIDVKHSVMLNNRQHNAIIIRDGQCVKTDMDGKKGEIDALSLESSNSVFQAIQRKNQQVLKSFVQRGNDLNRYYTNQKYTLLHYAIKHDNLEAAKYLVEQGADPNRFFEDKTALMYAIKLARIGITQYLLDKGVNVNKENYRKKTALYYAAKYGNKEVAKMLIDKGAVIEHRDYKDRSPIDYALSNQNLPVAEYLKLQLESKAQEN
ncbi:MAG: ankyrin repeat domain-containing protein [Bacteroidota bacterium]